MKIKSHKTSWAMALCAVAVFSFTAAREAQAYVPPAGFIPGPADTPPSSTGSNDVQPSAKPQPPGPLPPITPTSDGDVISSGTYYGTVATD